MANPSAGNLFLTSKIPIAEAKECLLKTCSFSCIKEISLDEGRYIHR